MLRITTRSSPLPAPTGHPASPVPPEHGDRSDRRDPRPAGADGVAELVDWAYYGVADVGASEDIDGVTVTELTPYDEAAAIPAAGVYLVNVRAVFTLPVDYDFFDPFLIAGEAVDDDFRAFDTCSMEIVTLTCNTTYPLFADGPTGEVGVSTRSLRDLLDHRGTRDPVSRRSRRWPCGPSRGRPDGTRGSPRAP